MQKSDHSKEFLHLICTSISVAGPQLRGEQTGVAHPQTAQPNSPIWLDNIFFFFRSTENLEKSKKVDQFGAMTFFFLRSTENLAKSRPAQKFCPPWKEILPPLEQRSSCGTAQLEAAYYQLLKAENLAIRK